MLQLLDDIQELKPTLFISVPRLFNRIYDRIMQTVEAQEGYKCWGTPTGFSFPPPSVKKYLFKKGYARKQRLLLKNMNEDGFWDSLVFSKVAERLGGRVRFILTGE